MNVKTKVDRIVAFGDSQTYGYYLTSENKGYGTSCHKDAWPGKLSSLLNIPVINNGVCGASNKEIWLEAIQFDYKPNDIVCILWSFFDRDFFPNGDTQDNILGFYGHYLGKKLIPNYYTDVSNTSYYKNLHTNFNSLLNFSLYKTQLASHLNYNNIPYIFMNLEVSNMPKNSFEWDRVNCYSINYVLNDFANDNSHYGTQSHCYVAEEFKRKINAEN